MLLPFTNSVQEQTYHQVANYLKSSMFKNSMRTLPDVPKFYLLYQESTLVEVEVLPWDIHPWEKSEMAIVRAYSYLTVGSGVEADLLQHLLAENRRMRFGAFQLDEAGQVLFAHSILGGENMDLLELQTCILSVAAIAANYSTDLSFGVIKQN